MDARTDIRNEQELGRRGREVLERHREAGNPHDLPTELTELLRDLSGAVVEARERPPGQLDGVVGRACRRAIHDEIREIRSPTETGHDGHAEEEQQG